MKKRFKSVRAKLFFALCTVIVMIIAFFIIVNNVVLETIYYYSRAKKSLSTYEFINNIDEKIYDKDKFESELEKISIKNNFEILILNEEKQIYASNKNFLSNIGEINEIKYEKKYSVFNKSDIMYSKGNTNIRKINDKKNGIKYILLISKLDNGNDLFLRMPISLIEESINISSRFLYFMGAVSIVLAGIAILFITEKFTKPIEELNDIANGMSNLNFEKKYRIHDSKDEIDELGKSINILSDKLENTINQLKASNIELERDIEEKSKIDEMRKQFISDVSHELKTPISLIQGYAEGLVENVISDEENKNFYAEVILDEANKMDKLVKRLLELMKLEYEERKFNDTKFDIVEMINEVIKNSKVILKEKKIDVEFREKNPIFVYADDFYIEQVVTNYFTNAIKNVKEVNGNKRIRISIKREKDLENLRICVFNTGNIISDENINRIWNRFYKIDESRNRSNGGTGIGLALVKAIMNRYNSNYGVKNKKDGVEFFFEVKIVE